MSDVVMQLMRDVMHWVVMIKFWANQENYEPNIAVETYVVEQTADKCKLT